jgi:hypothetical protein
MKKLLNVLAFSLLVFLGSAPARAVLVTDTHSYGTANGGLMIGAGSSFTDAWSLNPYGYRPGLDFVMSAVATFTLFEGETSNLYTISLDPASLLNGNNFKGIFTFGSGAPGSVLGQLSSTGMLSFTISNGLGSSPSLEGHQFRLQSATLSAELNSDGIAPTVAAVPDTGSTAALLGISIAAVAFLRQRLS